MALATAHPQTSASELTNHHWALRELPTFPAIVTKLLRALNDDGASIKQLVDLLRSDAALSAEILRRANSAAMGLRSHVGSLQHAVMVLGFTQLKNLAMAVSMSTYLKPAMKAESMKKCWKHSLAVAHLAGSLGRAVQFEHDRAYTAGMLHDMGMFGLMVHFPGEYNDLMIETLLSMDDLMRAEREIFELDHCEAGAALAEQWNFPPEICHVAGHHHDEIAPDDTGLTAIVHWSGRLASALGFEIVGSFERYQDVRELVPASLRAVLPESAEDASREIIAKVQSLCS